MSEGTQLPEFLKLTCSKLFFICLKQYSGGWQCNIGRFTQSESPL